MDGWMDGWVGGWMDGWMDGQADHPRRVLITWCEDPKALSVTFCVPHYGLHRSFATLALLHKHLAQASVSLINVTPAPFALIQDCFLDHLSHIRTSQHSVSTVMSMQLCYYLPSVCLPLEIRRSLAVTSNLPSCSCSSFLQPKNHCLQNLHTSLAVVLPHNILYNGVHLAL